MFSFGEWRAYGASATGWTADTKINFDFRAASGADKQMQLPQGKSKNRATKLELSRPFSQEFPVIKMF